MSHKNLLISFLSLMLTACGGGTATSNPQNSSVQLGGISQLNVDCFGQYCGASHSGYDNVSGADIGIFSYTNNSTINQTINFSIPMLASGKAYAVLTNLENVNKPMSSVKLLMEKQSTDFLSNKSQDMHINSSEEMHEKLLKKNQELLNNLTQGPVNFSIQNNELNIPINVTPAILGATQSFNILRNNSTSGVISTSDTSANFTLKKIDNLLDGVTIHYWVESTEQGVGKVTDATINSIQSKFSNGGVDNSVYAMIKSLSGGFYGNNNFSNLIAYDGTLNILISNITPDSTSYGMMGYFDAANLFTQASNAKSNQMPIVVIDSETLYVDGNVQNNTDSVLSALSHEFTHMVNFYQRGIVKYSNGPKTFSSAMEESSAMMMEDILSSYVGATAKNRYQQWVSSRELNCNIDDFNYTFSGGGCLDYPFHSAFGSFLIRKYGLIGYKYIHNDISQTSMSGLIDNMIKNNGGISLADELSKWHVSFVLSKFVNKPLDFGYPQQTIINGVNTFTFPKLDDKVYTGTTVSATTPITLLGYASFVSSYGALASGSTLQKTITIPAKSKISIVITP